MKSETIEFDCILGVKWFSVIYELYPNGRKLLMYIYYDDLPIDVAELATSKKPSDKELYKHIVAAMDNNAQSVLEEKYMQIKQN